MRSSYFDQFSFSLQFIAVLQETGHRKRFPELLDISIILSKTKKYPGRGGRYSYSILYSFMQKNYLNLIFFISYLVFLIFSLQTCEFYDIQMIIDVFSNYIFNFRKNCYIYKCLLLPFYESVFQLNFNVITGKQWTWKCAFYM